MSLTHLFKKRRSQKNKNTFLPSEADDGSKLKVQAGHEVTVEVNQVLQDLLDTVTAGDQNVHINKETDALEAPAASKVEKSDSLKSSDLHDSGNEKVSAEQNVLSNGSTRRIRSISEKTEENTETNPATRRKFGSESEITPLFLKDIPLQQKQLDEVIGKYVNKLIRNSICNAIKSVNVDSLYEEIVKDFSSRNNSESADSVEEFIVEQRLSSDSISELVELEAEDEGSQSSRDSFLVLGNSTTNYDETDSVGEETDDISQTISAGYLADLDDTASFDDSKSAEVNSSNYAPSTISSESFVPNKDIEVSDETPCEDISVERKTAPDTGNVIPKDCEFVNDSNDKSISSHVSKEHETEKDATGEKANSSSESTGPKYGEETVPDNTKIDTKTTTTIVSSQNSQSEHQKNNLSNENVDLILISPENECSLLTVPDSKNCENTSLPPDLGENLPQLQCSVEDEKKMNWKVGYLHVKLPHKARGKTQMKAWKKRRVAIQPDEFVNDPSNPSMVISVYGADSKKYNAIFWQAVSSKKAVVYRSSSRTHRYAFTVSEEGQAVIHLSAESESATQEWMAAIRAVLWPPSPFMQLEKLLSGREFEISLIDNDFSYHAGLLGMYGYLTITTKKLILLHPQEGYVIQEWYLNTVDKFQLVPQPTAEDAHKVLAMITCSDSSTGKGEILLFCNEAVTLLQSLATTIHQVLTYHSEQEGGKYGKELEEMAEWMVAPPQDCLDVEVDEHYRVPTRQVKSLLDIPNFIFEKSLSPAASAVYPAPNAEALGPLEAARGKQTTTSNDSGISTCTSSDDFLNCSVTSFVVGGGPMTGKSSDSELSDAYTPPRSPVLQKKMQSEKSKISTAET